jgi:hypothetical protein
LGSRIVSSKCTLLAKPELSYVRPYRIGASEGERMRVRVRVSA